MAIRSPGSSNKNKLFSKKVIKSLGVFTCGSFSGLISRLIISPFERVIIL